MNTDNSNPARIRLSTSTLSRRDVLSASALAGGALLLARPALAQPQHPAHGAPPQPGAEPTRAGPDKAVDFADKDAARTNFLQPYPSLPPGEPGKDYTPVIVPNGWTIPYKVVDGVKVFHIVAEEVEHEFAPGLKATCWGYNGGVHGPAFEVVEGDRVRIFLTNKLAASTTIHWHGFLFESGMDGVGGLSMKSVRTGETYMYEFTLRQHGTLMYHSHHDEMTQMGMGMTGLFIVH
ncbi:MAG: multicopper oxidase domain-containing protein, partial [Phycisphaerales bacterium]